MISSPPSIAQRWLSASNPVMPNIFHLPRSQASSRLFTSYNLPDARGLASFMQLNNHRRVGLLVVRGTALSRPRALVQSMVKVFQDDYLGHSCKLRFGAPVAKYVPPDSTNSGSNLVLGTFQSISGMEPSSPSPLCLRATAIRFIYTIPCNAS